MFVAKLPDRTKKTNNEKQKSGLRLSDHIYLTFSVFDSSSRVGIAKAVGYRVCLANCGSSDHKADHQSDVLRNTHTQNQQQQI